MTLCSFASFSNGDPIKSSRRLNNSVYYILRSTLGEHTYWARILLTFRMRRSRERIHRREQMILVVTVRQARRTRNEEVESASFRALASDFIDGANLYATSKTLGFDIDYKRLLEEFQSRGDLVCAFYYTAVIEDQEFSSIRRLIDWLGYNDFTIVTKATKEFADASGQGEGEYGHRACGRCHGTCPTY